MVADVVRFLLDHRAGRLDVWEMVAWACEARTADSDPCRQAILDQLASFDPRVSPLVQAADLLGSLLSADEREALYRAVAARAAGLLLGGESTPHEFCRAVDRLDTEVLGDPSGRYPVCLAALWDACDWSTEWNTKLSEVPWLESLARELAAGDRSE